MNDYIINPSFFYWANVVDGLIVVMMIISLVGIMASVAWAASLREYDKSIKKAIVTLVIAILVGVSAVFIPSKKAMIEMEIARNATKSNVMEMKKDVKDIADYVFEKIEQVDK